MKHMFLLLSLSIHLSVSAQFLTPQSWHVLADNVLYFEAFGNGETISLNYEQLVAQGENLAAGARFGFSIFPAGNQRLDMAIPITLSGLWGRGNIFAELGGGTSIRFSNALLEEGAAVIPTGILGLRYHPSRKGGIMIRLAYTPFWEKQALRHYGGFAVGFAIPR